MPHMLCIRDWVQDCWKKFTKFVFVPPSADKHELSKRGLKHQRQVDVPIVYDGISFDEGLCLDVLIENSIICELKAVEQMNPVWEAQILSHLKLTGKRLVRRRRIINFNVPLIKNGIKRFIV